MSRTTKWAAENADLLLSNKTDLEIQELFPKLKLTSIDRQRRAVREAVKAGKLKTKISARPLKTFPVVDVRKPKILIFDLETSYLIGKLWGIWEQNVIGGYTGVIQDWQILTIAWSWYGSGKTQVLGQDDFPDYVPGVNNDKSLVTYFYDLYNSADVVIAHHGKKFDFPRTRTRFFVHGLPPCKNPEEFDTKQISSSQFAFTSNRQGDISVQLKLDEMKMDPGGIKTWDGCQNGDTASWKLMKRYNKQDVVELSEIYEKFMPWVKKHPNLAQITGTLDACPRCLVVDCLVLEDYKYTQSNTYPLYRCTNCTGWSRGRTAIKSKDKVVYVNP